MESSIPVDAETRFFGEAFGGDNVDVDGAADAKEAINEIAAAKKIEPAGVAGLADDDLGGVVLKSDADEGGGDVFVVRDDDLGAEFGGEGDILFTASLVFR